MLLRKLALRSASVGEGSADMGDGRPAEPVDARWAARLSLLLMLSFSWVFGTKGAVFTMRSMGPESASALASSTPPSKLLRGLWRDSEKLKTPPLPVLPKLHRD